jgi:hypothetical protein
MGDNMSDQPILFISCGQVTVDEKQLGKDIVRLVAELTPFTPYFAEEVSSLDGLTNSILRALEAAGGFIAVMHPRGEVATPLGNHIRASVWVEQEIAIAAHLVHVHNKKIHVQAYVHRDIHLEGIREQLHLNPVRFSTSQEVLDDLRHKLPTWSVLDGGHLEVRIVPSFSAFRDGVAECQIAVVLRNRGSVTIADYHVDLEVPLKLLEGNTTVYLHEVQQRRTETHRFFRFPAPDGKVAPVYPDDERRACTVPFYVDRQRLLDPAVLPLEFVTTAYVQGKRVRATRKVAEVFGITDIQRYLWGNSKDATPP